MNGSLSEINIVDVIEPYTRLKKVGREWRGLCPFHKEKTPSFFVNQEKGVFYCHGCHKGGNAITFIAEIENVDYKRAEEILAERFGIQLDERPWEKLNKRERYLHLLKEVVRIYESNMKDPGLKYLKDRGISDETIHRFRLGYAGGLLKVIKDEEKRRYLADLFLIKERAGGGYYESLRGRVTFPIWTDNGFVVGIGGRHPGNGQPKYLNSRFKKEQVLYALNYTRKYIQSKGYAVVVEGYLDVLSLYQAGIKNVVAVLSSSLTRYHAELLKKYTDRVLLMFDPDKAGADATERAIIVLVESGLDIYIVNGMDDDPDAYVREHGVKAITERIKAATPYITTIPTYEKKIAFLSKIKNPPLDYIKKVADEYGLNPITVNEKIDRLRRGRLQKRIERKTGKILDLEKEVVAAMVNNMDVVHPYIYVPLFKRYRDIVEYMLSNYEESGEIGIPKESHFYNKYPEIIAYGYAIKRNYARDVARLFLKKYIDVAVGIEKSKIKKANDDSEIEKILRTIKELKELGKNE